MKRKILAILLAAAMVFTCAGNAFAAENGSGVSLMSAELVDSGTVNEEILWYLYSDGSLEIEGEGTLSTDIFASTYADLIKTVKISGSVESIGDGVFKGCTNLESVTLEQGVSVIGESAFYGCSSLTSIELPDSVSSIGKQAFYNCKALDGISLSSSVTSIGSASFYGCSSLKSINIPSSVSVIENDTFANCSSLTSIKLPGSVTSVGSYAFYKCSNLVSIVIPGTVTSIGDSAFRSCSSSLVICGETGSTAETYAKNNSITFAVLDPHELTAVEAKDATCTEAGNTKYYVCTICDKYYSDAVGANEIEKDSWVVEAKGHDEVSHEAKAATCTEAGWEAYVTCTRCDYSTYKEIPATGHSLTATEAKDATCTETGNSAYWTCSTCNKYFSDAEGKNGIEEGSWVTEAKGHDEVEHEAKAATCTEAGWDAYVTCTRCDYSTYKEIPATGHSLTAIKADEATNTENGNSAYWTCPTCNKYFSDAEGENEIEKDSWVIEPCTAIAITKQPVDICEIVGAKVALSVEAEGDELSYQWMYSKDGGETWITCTSSGSKTAAFSFIMYKNFYGRIYKCVITDKAGNKVRTDIVNIVSPFKILSQNDKITGTAGQKATLYVKVQGSVASVQWMYKAKGSDTWKTCTSSGSTTASWTFKLYKSFSGRTYKCVVTDVNGNVIESEPIALTVN